MNSTKRKFNSLLQGIASSPSSPSQHDQLKSSTSAPPIASPSNTAAQPSPSSAKSTAAMTISPVANEILNKRRRTGPPGSTPTKESSTVSNVILRKWSGNSKDPVVETRRQPPRYCPGDRDELIRRLGTYQDLTQWTPKPDRVNEIEWAKSGWVCHGKDRVRCTLCSKELVVRTNKTEVEGKEVDVQFDSDVEEALIDRLVTLIVDGHQEDCLWKRRGCDDSLLRLGLANPETAIPALRNRFDELCTRSSFLPYTFNLRLPSNMHLQTTRSHLPPNFFSDPPPSATVSSSVRDVALALALTGWQGLVNPRIGPVPNSATCATCLRRLGLWMFKSKEVNEETGEVLVPAPMDHLDPVREHRIFCPWRNGNVQRNPGSKSSDARAAWEVLALTLKNHSYLRVQAEKGNKPGKRPIMYRPSAPSGPTTPSKGGTAVEDASATAATLGEDMAGDEEEEDTAVREVKDKERWARLRRVKSLFDTKSAKKLRRTLSRPGTASSRPGTAASSRPDTAAASRPGTAATGNVDPGKA